MSNNVIIATGSYDHTISFWDYKEGKMMFSYEYP